MAQRFSQDEVVAVIRRALERRDLTQSGASYSIDDLIEIAAQCGVAERDVHEALTLVDLEARDAARGAAATRRLDRARDRKRRSWFTHAFTWGVVGSACGVLNGLTTDYPWSLFPIVLWSIGLIMHARFAFFPSHEALEELLVELESEDYKRQKRFAKVDRKQAELVDDGI